MSKDSVSHTLFKSLAKSQSNETRTAHNVKKLGGGKINLPYKML